MGYAYAFVRIRPTNGHIAWETSIPHSIKLLPQHAKTTLNPPPEFHFDEVLSGSENRPIYNAVARSHVWAAMEGYNAVIFAYGQTASGKTFTLVRISFTIHRHSKKPISEHLYSLETRNSLVSFLVQ